MLGVFVPYYSNFNLSISKGSILYDVGEKSLASFLERKIFLISTNRFWKMSLPENYQKTIQTFKKMSKKIKRSLEQPYSNGPLESLNNHIKVLKRNIYGFRSFYNVKLRINLCFGEAHFKLNKKA
ncbi:transposase [Enterococcus sp. BWB1-3]|nr:transposase [Enterococcus sp. BWB1-3]